MGAVLACCACEAASCCIGSTISCCGRAIPMPKSIGTRIAYALLFLLTVTLAWVLSEWGQSLLSWIPEMGTICGDGGDSSDCFGKMAVLRCTFALAMFHFIFSLMFIGVKDSSDFRSSIQDGWWFLKIAIFACLMIISFLIPNVFYSYWVYFAIVGAGVFIVIQSALLVDFAWTWTEAMIKKYEEQEDKRWFYLLLATSLTLYAMAITVVGLSYAYFCTDVNTCYYNIILITVSMFLCIAFSVASVTEKVQEANPRAGLLQSAFVSLYISYLVVSSMLSEPNETCNPFTQKSQSAFFQNVSIFGGALFAIISVCYATVNAATFKKVEAERPFAELSQSENGEVGTEGATQVLDDEIVAVSYSYSFFHLTFACGALYIGELLTNWVTQPNLNINDPSVNYGWFAFGVKVASGFLVVVLFLWTMIAPVILPDREWN